MNLPPPAPLPPPIRTREFDQQTGLCIHCDQHPQNCFCDWGGVITVDKVLADMVLTPAPAPVPKPVVLAPPPPAPAPLVPQRKPGPTINVRAKGQRGEREVVKLLQAIVDNVMTRHGRATIQILRNQMQTAVGGEDLSGLTGFAVEVKFQENENLPAWWRQTCAQAAARNAVPILFWRCSRAKWSVKFRAFVNTPNDMDQIEMDLETSVDDFTEWFGNAFEERVMMNLPL